MGCTPHLSASQATQAHNFPKSSRLQYGTGECVLQLLVIAPLRFFFTISRCGGFFVRGFMFFSVGHPLAISAWKVLPGCRHGQLAVFDPFGSDEFIGNIFDQAGLAANQDDLQTVVVVQVDMDGGNDHVVVIVLNSRQYGLEVLFVMVRDQRNGPDHLLTAEFLPMFDQRIANHVGNGQGTVVIF